MVAAESNEARTTIWTRSFVTVLLAQMTFGYASSSFLLLPKFLATQLHAGPGQIGHVTAVTSLASVLAIPFVGAAIDRFGRKPLVITGCVMTAVYAFAWILVDRSSWLIDALQVLGGIGFMVAFNAAGTLVADQAPRQRLGQAIGIFGAANMAMSAISPVITELLAVGIGWHAAFGLAGIVALVSLAVALRIDEQARPATAMRSGLGLGTLLALLKRQLPHSFAMATCGAAYGAVSTFYQPFMIAQGATHVSAFFVGFTVAAVSIRVFFGSLPDRFGRRPSAIASYIGFAIMVLAMTQLTPSRLLVFGFLFGCMHGIFYPALSALCVEQAESEARGRVMTLVMGSFRLGSLTSAVVLGAIAESYGYKVVFVLAALTSALGVGALLAIPDGKAAAEPGATPG